MINVSLNNQIKSLSSPCSLSDALALWDFDDKKIAVAINNEFVARSTYGERMVKDGDKIDVVKPIGGG